LLTLAFTQKNITRSKEEAIEILKGYETEIKGSSAFADKFAELATDHSDCSSHAKGGDLGWFGPGQMQKAFEDAAFGLEVGKMSEIISSDSGVHLVLRTG
jgi:NIMA-interacting peptidyl-prolyl cis-trans isomerase 1